MTLAPRHFSVVIVGGGHSAAQAAIALRQRKFEGTVAIIGEETELPYERPPLSKDYLAGRKPFERLLIRPATFWHEREIAMLTGQRVVSVDPDAKIVRTHDGTAISYDDLIWAAGGHARALTGVAPGLAGIHTVRTRADIDRMMGELLSVTHVAVIGGGYIGLETAAVLAKLGKRITLIEAQERLLARVGGAALSHFYESEHRAHGVDIRLNETVAEVQAVAGKVSGLRLGSGEVIPAEMIVVGIGIIPAIEPLLAAGARGGNGVEVDGNGQTSLPHVYAAGDCALHTNRYAGGRLIRLESVQNANDMATAIARAIMVDPEPYNAIPWFWSNQYDLKLQTIGLSVDHDEEIVRGDPADRSFSIIYRKEGRVIALDCINATMDYVQGKLLVAAEAKLPREMLENSAVPLKQILEHAA